MRLFFALWPDAAVQRTLAEWAQASRAVCGGRVPPASRLHVTLAFLGEVQAARYRPLVEIGDSIRSAAFEFVFDELGYWRRQRIVYAAASAVPSALSELAGALLERLRAGGFYTEARAFVPHVTLLRDARRPPEGVGVEPLAWRVGALSLVETLRGQGKLAYRQRECWTLPD